MNRDDASRGGGDYEPGGGLDVAGDADRRAACFLMLGVVLGILQREASEMQEWLKYEGAESVLNPDGDLTPALRVHLASGSYLVTIVPED